MNSDKKNLGEIMVSVCCLAYNHESFIGECLEGFVKQQANFAFEVLIHDDASTDKTADIIRAYAEKYPDIIKPVYQTENQYSKGVGVTRKYNFSRAKGKYIAMCEGDDYWIDPLKLQKQVDFLEANESYGVVHTDANVYHQKTNTFIENIIKLRNRNLIQLDNPAEAIILGSYRVYTLTVLFRFSLLEKIDMDSPREFQMGDLPLWLTFTKFTKFFYINEATAVYRKTQGSATNPIQKAAKLDFKISSKKVRLLFAKSLNLKASTVNEISDRYHRAVLRKKFELSESHQAFKIFSEINKKTIKDTILLLGSKSKIFKSIMTIVKPNMS